MSLKKIPLFTIVLLIPSFIYLIMCPFAHSLTLNGSSQLLVLQQQIQNNNLQQKEYTSTPIWHTSLYPFNLQAYGTTFIHLPQLSGHPELFSILALLETIRLNL